MSTSSTACPTRTGASSWPWSASPPPRPRRRRRCLSLAPPAEVEVPAGATFNITTAEGATLPFRTVEPLHAVPAVLRSILVQTAPDPAPPHGLHPPLGGRRRVRRLWRRPAARRGALARLRRSRCRPIAGAAGLCPQRRAQRGRRAPPPAGRSRRAGSRLPPSPAAAAALCPAPRCTRVPAPALPDPLQHHSARVTWQFYGATGWTDLAPPAVRDDTRALTLDGSVTVRLPAAMAAYPKTPPPIPTATICASG